MKVRIALAVLVCLPLALAGCQAGLPFRGDVHLTVTVEHRDLCELLLEARAGSLSALLLDLIPEGQTQRATAKTASLAMMRTERDGKEYAALQVRFDSVDNLVNVMNAPNLARLLLEWLGSLTEVPEPLRQVVENVPTPFSQFSIEVEESSSWQREFHFVAEVDAAIADLLTEYTDITYHVRLPGIGAGNNAQYKEQGALAWRLRPGEPLRMEAHSRMILGQAWLSTTWCWGGAMIVVLLAFLGGGAYWWGQRSTRRRKPVPVSEEPFDFGEEYAGSELDEYGDSGLESPYEGYDDLVADYDDYEDIEFGTFDFDENA